MKTFGKRVALILIPLAIFIGFGQWLHGYVFDNNWAIYKWLLNNVWKAWLFPGGWNLLHATPFFWMLVVSIILGSVITYIEVKKVKLLRYGSTERNKLKIILNSAIGLTGFSFFVVFVLTTFMWGNWNAEFYNKDTQYVVDSETDLPTSLMRVATSDTSQVEIVEGELPMDWVSRNASATGARYVMQKTGDTIQNTKLMSETISYIYDKEGEGGEWTAIRNGVKRQPVYGITTWRGTGEDVKTCTFSGDNSLNKAFNGMWGMNLNNSLAKFDSSFVWDSADMYGYCDDSTPVIVIPGIKVVSNKVQAANDTIGVITVKGSSNGEPVIEYVEELNADTIPGGVYPKALLNKQRNALKWSAGRVWPWQSPVGFSVSGSVSQTGNNSDFMLKNRSDNRLYWVTPMKPLNADSETISAYSITLADEVTQGMNTQNVYVLNDDNEDIVNFNDLENAVTQAVSKVDPGFFTGGEDNVGAIVEFTPKGAGEWRVFAERGGRAVYEIKISGGSKLHTSVLAIEKDSELLEEGSLIEENVFNEDRVDTVSNEGCDSPKDLTDAELVKCISELTSELEGRYQE